MEAVFHDKKQGCWHSWQFVGKVITSTDRTTEGRFHFVCINGCGGDLYAERVVPAGKTMIREMPRRYRNDEEKRRAGR